MTESVCKDIGHVRSLGKFFRMDSESDDATDCNAKAGSSQSITESSDLCGVGVGPIGNSNNAPEIEETECGSDSEGLSVSGSSTTSCSTATTPPPSEMTPKGLCLLFYHHSVTNNFSITIRYCKGSI